MLCPRIPGRLLRRWHRCTVPRVLRHLAAHRRDTRPPLASPLLAPLQHQVPNADFFLKTVPLLDGGADVGMVLSPQAGGRAGGRE